VVVITKANQKRIEESLQLPGDLGSLVDLEGTQLAHLPKGEGDN
jgi:hypothetical protein